MLVMYNNGEKEKQLEVSDFYYEIAIEMSKEKIRSDSKIVTVTVADGSQAVYKLTLRSGTIFICELSNTLSQPYIREIKPVFLTCVNPEKNAYKFYRLEPVGDKIKASYGRMGVKKGELFGERSFIYPKSMFWIIYFEKIAKGYIDRTELYISQDEKKEEGIGERKHNPGKPDLSSASAQLFLKLKNLAKCAVRQANVQVPITQPIIDNSKALLDSMRKAASTKEFNGYLLSLISILQRPVKTGDGTGVLNLMAICHNNFASIIERESNLIQAMEGSLSGDKQANNGNFADYDIEVYKANGLQTKEVFRHLSDDLGRKVKRIYRVISKVQQEKFNAYLKNNHITRIQQFWHGSRNENWMSIILNSLKLNPDAVITGKMFGKGIYFAPSSMKSWNYTSFRGTYWAKGNSDIAFMGLYAAAYGKPYDVDTWSTNTAYNKQLLISENCNCLHAHAGSSLKNDEIIFYDEDSIVLNYIVEFYS